VKKSFSAVRMPHFYSLTLLKASGINLSVSGNFSGPKSHEIVVARGKALELLRPNEQGRMDSICYQEVFGQIRSMVPFRLVGATVDHLVIGSDSGKVVILQYDVRQKVFTKVHEEAFGRSGCRRVVPGEYIAMDPKGRAFLISAIERQKFVYILNRDTSQKLRISSPLDAHKNHTIVFSTCGLDVGYENPLFACIESVYDHANPSKTLTIYEMDLGVNHVTRKYAEPVPESAHLLIPVPGGSDGPGGCLICLSEGVIIYKKLGQTNITCNIPKRTGESRESMVVGYARHKLKDFTLILVQTEEGDLFRIDLISPNNMTVDNLRITYFDTLPIRSLGGICILKSGFMFVASESGDHGLYQFLPGKMLQKYIINEDDSTTSVDSFDPHPELVNLVSFEGASRSLAPVTDIKVMDPLSESVSGGACQIFAVGGRGPNNAYLRALRYGVGVTEMALTDLPGKPSGVWTIPGESDEVSQYIVLSFTDATLVLSIGETVSEVSDSGFVGTVRTIFARRMFDQSLIQIHPKGVRQIKSGAAFEWRPREGRNIVFGAANTRQIVVALTGGEIVYLELRDNTLVEVAKRDLGSAEPTSISIEEIGESKSRAFFMAVSGSDKAVRVLSLDLGDKLLKQVSAQVYECDTESTAIGGGFLSIGLVNGTLVRCCLDPVTGRLSDARWRFLGVRPVRLATVNISNSTDSLFAMSSRPWVIDPVSVGGIAPLSYMQIADGVEMPVVLEHATSFNSEQCPDGFVGISRNSLRIFGITNITDPFSERKMKLDFTPKKLVVVPPIGNATNVFLTQQAMLAVVESDGIDSCIRIVDPVALETVSRIDFETPSESALSACVAYFYQLKDNRPCLIVASAESLSLRPRSAQKSVLRTYLYDENFVPQLVHVTPCGEAEDSGAPVPLAMCSYEGRLLVSFSPGAPGSPSLIRLYELGKKRLLRKTEYRNFVCGGGFVTLQVEQDRIFAADMHHSVHVLKLNRTDGQIYTICDDANQRYMSAMLAVDYSTVIGADKFDNIFTLRVPSGVRSNQNSTGESLLGSGGLRLGPDTAYILDKTTKLDQVNSFHLGDMVTSLQKVSMSTGAAEVVMYSTLNGAIGVMYPFPSRKEYETFLNLEMHLRNEMGTSLVGRDHQNYRSNCCPVKGVVDGDFIRKAFRESRDKEGIAQKLGKSINEIIKMIEEIQNRIT
jgi:splicing factor 3B subunit 3